jgi:threonine/homoserine/homoserine lactone efflux protein
MMTLQLLIIYLFLKRYISRYADGVNLIYIVVFALILYLGIEVFFSVRKKILKKKTDKSNK